MRERWRLALARSAPALLLGLVLTAPAALAQPPGSLNEREVTPQTKVDAEGIWVLDFRFKDPRVITVDVPGRGRQIIWYLWYQVVNYTGKPRTFIPDFELVTGDQPDYYHDKPGIYRDEVLPKVQEAIRKIEDPTGALDIKNSVTISTEPIPPTQPGDVPRKVTGLAIWDDTSKDQSLSRANHFSIFVAGLSNGWSVDDNGTVRRKTLQLKFKRPGTQSVPGAREINFEPPPEWLYRASSVTIPGAQPAAKEGEAPKPGGEVPKKEDAAPAPGPAAPPASPPAQGNPRIPPPPPPAPPGTP
ncbi:MAG: hypothetical protein JO112_13005 [Planctomycetes bacterium]|nr:hypothetical protein [Planctomycetota bacterium]